MQKKRVFGWMTAAGCALYAVSAMGAASSVVSESFEGFTPDTSVTTDANWSGYGTVTSATYTAANTDVGLPIGSAAHAKVLAVEGRVTRTAATTLSNATVDMMVQIATPDDALAFPSGTDTAGIQIAAGVETNATLKVYCKNKSNEPGWYPLGSTTYTVGSWHRVSFTFDYANKTCQVLVDGNPAVSATGYLTAAASGDGNGSWYKLAKADASALASVQVIGSTSIDDLLVQESATATDVEPVVTGSTTGGGATVPNSWFVEQGVAREDVAAPAPDNSGMTVAQKYVTGLSVADGQVFAITDMTMSGNMATLTVPTATAASGYVNKIQYSTDKETWTDADVTASGTVSVNVNPGNAGTPPAVIYVRLVNKASN